MVRRLLVGCYPDVDGRHGGVWLTSLDEASGQLSEARLIAPLPSASFLAAAPAPPVGETRSSALRLFAIVEAEQGEVCELIVTPDAVREVARRSSGGAFPCHARWLDGPGGGLVVANYGDGVVARFAPDAAGRLPDDPESFPGDGRGPVLDRQEGPHAHHVQVLDPGGVVAVCDLGADWIRLFEPRGAAWVELPPSVMPAGCGPRHLARGAVAGDSGRAVLYLSCELSGQVLPVRWDASARTLTPLAALPASGVAGRPLPEGRAARSQPSGIEVSEDGVAVLIANRGPGTIASFATSPDGALRPVDERDAGCPWPRGFTRVPAEEGEWLVVAGQDAYTLTTVHCGPGLAAEPATGPGVLSDVVGRIRLPGRPSHVLPLDGASR